MGRPTKYNDARCATIIAKLKAGNTRATSAALAGVSYDCFLDWLHKGKDPNNPDYRQFLQAVHDAEAYAEAQAVASIVKSAKGYDVVRIEETVTSDGTVTKRVQTRERDWRAAAWFLEHGRHKDWQTRKTLNVTDLTDAQIVALLEEEAEDGSGEAGDPSEGD